eukprot:scaffold170491_cov17-Prasinocladus_malaysianus.AAC.1
MKQNKTKWDCKSRGIGAPTTAVRGIGTPAEASQALREMQPSDENEVTDCNRVKAQPTIQGTHSRYPRKHRWTSSFCFFKAKVSSTLRSPGAWRRVYVPVRR